MGDKSKTDAIRRQMRTEWAVLLGGAQPVWRNDSPAKRRQCVTSQVWRWAGDRKNDYGSKKEISTSGVFKSKALRLAWETNRLNEK